MLKFKQCIKLTTRARLTGHRTKKDEPCRMLVSDALENVLAK